MTKENSFSPKMEPKSIRELKTILNTENGYVYEARQAAGWELEKREEISGDKIDEMVRPTIVEGEDNYRNFIKEIKPKHSFGFYLKYSESFQTELSYDAISSIFAEAFEKLDWRIVFHQKKQIEAKRRNSFDQLTEKITAVIEKSGRIHVISESLSGVIWDSGRNSKRVKLLIHVFNEVASTYNGEKLESLLSDIKKSESLEDYNIPESLPNPKKHKDPNRWIPILIGVVTSAILGFIFSFALNQFYIIILYELVIGLILGFFLAEGMKLGNYTNYIVLRSILGFSTVAIVVFGQYFQFLFLVNEYNFTFIKFMELRFEAGFEFDGYDMGWIGLIIVFIIQLFAIYYFGLMNFLRIFTSYQINRIPAEVIDFSFYYWMKTESEDQIRKELSLKGWTLESDQDKVFEAMGAISHQQEASRGA